MIVEDESSPTEIDFTNGSIQTQPGTYTGTESDIKRAFGLNHNNDEIFERYFTGNDSDVVNLTENTITIPNHFYVTGEKLNIIMLGNYFFSWIVTTIYGSGKYNILAY